MMLSTFLRCVVVNKLETLNFIVCNLEKNWSKNNKSDFKFVLISGFLVKEISLVSGTHSEDRGR